MQGKPVQLTLRDYLDYFLKFREETIRKRTNYFLKITSEKFTILEGFSIATKNIKIIIEIIQNSENANEAKSILIVKLKLSEKHWPLVYPFLTFLKVIENIDEEADPVIEESLRKI